jgi:hypothetical protein
VRAGLGFALELRDGENDAVRLPAEGMFDVGVESDPMKLRVMLVPIAYESPTCSSVGIPQDADLQAFGDALFQTFPVQELQLFVRDEPVAWNELLDSNWAGLLEKLIVLRGQDDIAADIYYIGLVDFCDEDPFVSAAAAGLPSAAPEDAYLRVGITSLYPVPQGDGGATGLLFSVAVLNGRPTVPCFNGAGLDESYPYEGGYIGGWGYGIVDGELRSPEVYVDLVAGCMSPVRWVSDYTWRGLYGRIQAITAWAG